jgi:tetratricopeptide (TPR) repeat protein
MDSFPEDRRHCLFGRERDIETLLDRATSHGWTALAGRPLMGKTWTVTEVARRLLATQEYLIGYHESKGPDSPILRAVANLYALWLSDSTMRQQALSLWERHKDNIVPKLGQAIGSLFEAIAGTHVPAGIGRIVKATFDRLADAQQDLLTGGMSIDQLQYDQAYALVDLIARLSGRRIVLMLDAWEKTASITTDVAIFDAFLKHSESWSCAHIIVTIRNPELISLGAHEELMRRVRSLCRISPSARLLELAPIELSDASEGERLCAFVKTSIPAAKGVSAERILDLVDGFPGVLSFWTNTYNSTGMRQYADLRTQAANAHVLRYLELEQQLEAVKDPVWLRSLMILACLPRLTADTWALVSSTLPDVAEPTLPDMADSGLVLNEQFPTYGHDTRHEAAFRWFYENKRNALKKVASQIVKDMSASMGPKSENETIARLLIDCSDRIKRLYLKSEIAFIVSLAFGRMIVIHENIVDPERLNDWSINPLLGFGPEFDLHFASISKNYPNAAYLCAKGLLFRAMISRKYPYSESMVESLNEILALHPIPVNVAAVALRVRASARKGGHEGLQDLSEILKLRGVDEQIITYALIDSGLIYQQMNDLPLSDRQFQDALNRTMSPQERGIALGLLGYNQAKREMTSEAVEYLDRAIDLLCDSPEHQNAARFNRGYCRLYEGRAELARADCVAILESGHDELKAVTLALAAAIDNELGDRAAAINKINDAISAIEQTAEPDQLFIYALLVCKGITKGAEKDYGGAIECFSEALQRCDGQVSFGCYNRAVCLFRTAQYTAAVDDCDCALASAENLSSLFSTRCLTLRGVAKACIGDQASAIEDCTAAYKLAFEEQLGDDVWGSLLNRGWAKYKIGDFSGAIEDYTAVSLNSDESHRYALTATAALELATKVQRCDESLRIVDFESSLDPSYSAGKGFATPPTFRFFEPMILRLQKFNLGFFLPAG